MTRPLTRVIFCALIPLLSPALFVAASGKPDFSGTWVLNLEKSRLDPRMHVEMGTITIDHREPQFHFHRLFVTAGKNDEFSYALTTDGKETVAEEKGQTVHSHLYWDGDVLVYSVLMVRQDGRQATNIVRYSLRDGGKTIVAEEKFRGPILKYDNLWISDRKS